MASLLAPVTKSRSRKARKAFRFMHLPPELRLRVYAFLFKLPSEHTIDLDVNNEHHLAPLFLPLFILSRQVHFEASQYFYSSNVFRLFPTQGKFFRSMRPLLARLPPEYRQCITRMELRLGPGWNAPPKGWTVTERLGLGGMVNFRKLRVFVEFDPASNEVFRGFRPNDTFSTEFSVNLLRDVLFAAESIDTIEFDAYPSVRRDSPLMVALLSLVRAAEKDVIWGLHFQDQDRIEDLNTSVDPKSKPSSLDVLIASLRIDQFSLPQNPEVLSEA